MSEARDWQQLSTYLTGVDLDMYLEIPEDLSRRIEIKDGLVTVCESPSPNHNAIARNLQAALLRGIAARRDGSPCLRVNGDVDMLVSEVPFHFKRPDVIVYRRIDTARPRWRKKPLVADTLLVVEVVSPSTITADTMDKRVEYARFGIPHYWIVRMAEHNGPVASIEMLQLGSDGTYSIQQTAQRSLATDVAISMLDPFTATVTWTELDLGVD
ncbi:Uma2 family endonuclease [Actinomadura parmotrematis]|uniref:Uma2 family endonuclease n=1 Tax=Actinomadura parmotrematis TaxID=2864039 RepID=A0ABS7G4E5_9ACTN|nr:Uma2 family endonuclease [Actinomadura parmotrematis]MBW8487579.1 Uma2 family endonuclease [Actinomadura parmotrematis]